MIKFALFNVLFFMGFSQLTQAEQVLHSQCFREPIASVERVKYEVAQRLIAQVIYNQDPGDGRNNADGHEPLEYDVSVERCENGSWPSYRLEEGPLGARVKIVVPTIVDAPRSLFRGE